MSDSHQADVERRVRNDNASDYWPCACVKRDRAGNLTHIKQNHHTVKRCGRCKAERPE